MDRLPECSHVCWVVESPARFEEWTATCLADDARRNLSHPGKVGGPDTRMIVLVEGRTVDGCSEEVPARAP